MSQKQKYSYPRHKDHMANGEIDWISWDNACRAAGYKCKECNRPIILADAVGPAYCYICSLSQKPEKWSSPNRIRCPGCSVLLDPLPALPEGMLVPLKVFPMAVYCTGCNTQFEFTVKLEYEFESPPLLSIQESLPAADSGEASQILEEVVPRE